LFGILAKLSQSSLAHGSRRCVRRACRAGKVRTVGEAIRSPEAKEREIVTRIPHPKIGWVPNVRLPIRYSRTPIVDPVAAPAVGQHTKEVLCDLLGYDEGRLAQLAQAGAFGGHQRRPESAES